MILHKLQKSQALKLGLESCMGLILRTGPGPSPLYEALARQVPATASPGTARARALISEIDLGPARACRLKPRPGPDRVVNF